MNKTRYKVIFNKKRGLMMAVAEHALREGKSSADRPAGSVDSSVTAPCRSHQDAARLLSGSLNPDANPAVRLGMLGFSLMLLAGAALIIAPAAISPARAAGIVADPNAPGNQRPTVLQSANGTPQVNIQTPSAGGVSVNQYQQFDVAGQGASLNNSRNNTPTQIGGWIQGNPWLAGGEARIIVNQINSSNPSLLNGYIEVAGRRAEVIMANPAGIQVNGGGFINAASVTLTSGTPVLNNGHLEGFRVRSGTVAVNGKGWDTSGADYTRILAQAAQINAGIWGKELQVITGRNDIDAAGGHTGAANAAGSGNTAPDSSASGTPAVAIDTGRLGGMYAQKITLISTDKGVGVNHAGQIFAGAGGVSLTADGKISNSGSIVAADKSQAAGDADAAAVHLAGYSLSNSGSISARGKAGIRTQSLNNSGLIVSANELNIRNQGSLSNSGQMNAARVDVVSGSLSNSGRISQTGLQSLVLSAGQADNRNQGLIGATPVDSGTPGSGSGHTNPGSGTGSNSQTPPGTASGGGSTGTVPAAPMTLADGQISLSGSLNNDGGQITANGGMDMTVRNGLTNQASLYLDRLTVTGDSLDNRGGQLYARQADVRTQTLDNRSGKLTTVGSLQVQSGRIDNQGGQLLSAGSSDLQAGALDNRHGHIGAEQSWHITAAILDNSEQGRMVSGKRSQVNAATLYNRQGSIDAGGLHIQTQALDNRQGRIRTNEMLDIQASGSLNNQSGQISSAGQLAIHDQQAHTLLIDNADGHMLAGSDGRIQSQKLARQGTLAAGRDLSLALQDDFSVTQDISAGRTLSISTAGRLINPHTLQGGAAAVVSAQNIDNTATGKIQSGDRTEVTATDTVRNRGLINSNGSTLIKAGEAIDNIGSGKIYGDHVAIGAVTLNNREETVAGQTRAAVIAARQRLDIGAQEIHNREQALLYSGGVLAVGGSLDARHQAQGMAALLANGSARIESAADMKLAAKTLRNTNEHFSVETYLAEAGGPVKAYALKDSSTRYQAGKDGWWDRRSGERNQQYAVFNLNDGNQVWGEHWHIWDYQTQTYKQKVKTSAPGEIIAGGHLYASGDDWLNQDSHILLGGSLIDEGLSVQLKNRATPGKGRIETVGSQFDSTWRKGWYKGKRQPRRFETNHDSYNSTQLFEHDFAAPVMLYRQHDRTLGGNRPQIDQAGSVQTISAGPADNQVNIKSTQVTTGLPGTSLFAIQPDHNGWLIETDPAFTDYKQWLSSDYMLGALKLDPATRHKRLGDGYYEQRLINEQIAQLTGYRRLDGHQNDEDQFKALMDAGVTFAQAQQLTPGIALSAEQIARLTSDIVWLETQTVTLPDGSRQTVLAPKVYVVARPGDLNASGSLISAEQIRLNLQNGHISNSGTIAGRKLVDLGAQNISNLAGGRISGRQVLLSANDSLQNLGGSMDAEQRLQLQARDIRIESTRQSSGDQHNGQTNLDRVAGLYMTGTEKGTIHVTADRQLDINAADIRNQSQGGQTLLAGQKALNIGTLTEQRHESTVTDARNYRTEHRQSEVGSRIQSSGDLALYSQGDIRIRQGQINSDKGTVALAGRNIDISVGRHSGSVDAGLHHSSDMGISSHSLSMAGGEQYSRAQGSDISGKQVLFQAAENIHVDGSNIISDDKTWLSAGKNIRLSAATNTYSSHRTQQETDSGLMGTGGIGFFIGTKQDTTEADSDEIRHSGSTVGSLKGDTILSAGTRYTQTGSIVSAPEGNVRINAQAADIQAAQDRYSSGHKHTFEQKGLTVAVNVPVVNAIQGAVAAVKSADQVGQSKNSRVNAMAAANNAWRGYQAASSMAGLAKNPPAASQDISVSITYGEQKNTQETKIQGTRAQASQVIGGGTVNISASGGGKDANLNIIGSDVAGKQGTHLQADQQVNLMAAQQEHSEHSQNKSAGWNAGVAISYGQSGMAFGITAGGNYGKGYGNGDETSWRNSHVGDAGSRTTIQSGSTTHIQGAQVTGKGVGIDAAALNIESLQDTATFKGKQQNIEGQITVGYGASGSASYSQSKVNADYAAVREQSGLFAGDDGYQINIKGHTDLKGGLITSTAQAEADGKNRFSTATLSHSDLANKAEYSGSSIGFGGGFSMGGGDGPKEVGGHKLMQLGQNSVHTDSVTGQGQINGQLGNYQSIGYGRDSDRQSSVTHSGINTANIIITDAAAQQSQTGHTAGQTIAAVKTDISTDNHARHTGYLNNNFDKDKVLNELNLQVKVTKEFRQNAFSAIDQYTLPKQAELRDQIKTATSEAEKTRIYDEIYKLQYQKRFLETLVGIVAGTPDAAITQGTLQLAATKMREESLANSRKFAGITDGKTNLSNVSYGSGYFDGVKLGGVRIDLDAICGAGDLRCNRNLDGSYLYTGDDKLKTLSDAINPSKNPAAKDMYGATGGFQAIGGEMFGAYKPNSWKDLLVESFAGTHDYTGGQIWGWYDEEGNTTRRRYLPDNYDALGSSITAVVAIPTSAPFALSDLISPDMLQIILKIGSK